MSNYIQHTVLRGWHLRRFMGLGAGLFLAYQAIAASDGLTALLSGIFLLQAVTNTGCFGRSGCAVPYTNNSQRNASLVTEEADYEEVT